MRLYFPPDSDYGKLGRIAVLKSYRGIGIGKQLVLGCEDVVKHHSKFKLVMDAQKYAQQFYERCGYVVLPEYGEYYDEGILHVRMEKSLK